MSFEILHRDDLRLGGFAGLKEHRLVMDPQAFGSHVNPGTWPGMGNFVYLADARFNPQGQTEMHSHREIDVISVMVDGRIAHEGSLEHGQELRAYDVQVQRAGGEGFSHNEINPDAVQNRMIQLWFLPQEPGLSAGYQLYRPKTGEVIPVYGGNAAEGPTYESPTCMEVGLLKAGQDYELKGEGLAYLIQGSASANGVEVGEGDLMRGSYLSLKAETQVHFIGIHLNN